MCYFLLVAVDEQAVNNFPSEPVPRVQAIAVHNRSALAAVGAHHAIFALVEGGCSCSLYRPADESLGLRQTKLRRKYEAKGWSAAKVQRAVSQAMESTRRSQRDQFTGLHPDIANRLLWLTEQIGRLAICIHFFSGGLETEAIPLGASTRIIPTDLHQTLPEDRWLWLTEKHS